MQKLDIQSAKPQMRYGHTLMLILNCLHPRKKRNACRENVNITNPSSKALIAFQKKNYNILNFEVC